MAAALRRSKSPREELLFRRQRFARARRAEEGYARQLKQVARHVGNIIRGFAPRGEVSGLAELTSTLRRYSDILRPWARAAAARFVTEVAQRDESAWAEVGKEMGRNIKAEIRNAPTGEVMRQKLAEQVHLITSLPVEAAERVHRLTIEARSSGVRAKEIAQEIMRSGEVTASRAVLIARTESGRVATSLTEARAQHIGSEGYIWRSVGDIDVRPLHRKLNGKFIRWDSPPIAGEDGERAHAGAIYNCRCIPEPVLPDEV